MSEAWSRLGEFTCSQTTKAPSILTSWQPWTRRCETDLVEGGNDAPDMEVDPVCGMKIVPSSAAAERVVDGKRFFFCSKVCGRRFDADTGAFVLKSNLG
jgi:YHS domain-containing protein